MEHKFYLQLLSLPLVTSSMFSFLTDVPEAPREVSVVNETSTTVTLSATSSQGEDGLPITSWMVTCEKEGGSAADSKTHFFGDGQCVRACVRACVCVYMSVCMCMCICMRVSVFV